uniref:Uncharacterized protein n=1 Tax=Euplotes harpa TaxID=151035 RepID=A0A7S3JI48_9SPIT|mmetsp:Transcript_37348/g.42888  ORF Transcript_37348/g.42888 Transcript_37348/m.42888 type:complete len:191 (+) Transcript_37348:62-634(+)
MSHQSCANKASLNSKSNKDEISALMKNSSPAKSDSNLKDQTTSDFKSNRETTEDDRGYEIINAKDFYKQNDFPQFDTLKDHNTMMQNDNSPVSSTERRVPLNEKKQELKEVTKPPINNTPRPKPTASRIPGITKPSSVVRTSSISPKEEQKRHKGKTPSFGNSNTPLFMNNFQTDNSDMNSGTGTPSYSK